jgi:hypothetical protein
MSAAQQVMSIAGRNLPSGTNGGKRASMPAALVVPRYRA